jgi:hypothetical protein
LSDDDRVNSPRKSSPANDHPAEGFGGIFDVVGNLFGSSETSPSPERDTSAAIRSDDMNAVITTSSNAADITSDTSTGADNAELADADRSDSEEGDAWPRTGDQKKDGWWSGLEAAVSDADHVVIEHRHLFEVSVLVLMLLMVTALCVGCCCCYAGKRGSSGDYGGSKGSSGFGDGGFDDVGATFSNSYEKYHDVEDPPVDVTASINGDGPDSVLMDRERSAMRAERRKSRRSQVGKKYEKVVDDDRIPSKRKKKPKHKEKDGGGRRHSSRSSRHTSKEGVVEEYQEEEDHETDSDIGGTAKSRRKSRKKKNEFVPPSFSHDLFGTEDDAEVTFDGGTLFGGQDDIWSDKF